jgi:hypothetical protein
VVRTALIPALQCVKTRIPTPSRCAHGRNHVNPQRGAKRLYARCMFSSTLLVAASFLAPVRRGNLECPPAVVCRNAMHHGRGHQRARNRRRRTRGGGDLYALYAMPACSRNTTKNSSTGGQARAWVEQVSSCTRVIPRISPHPPRAPPPVGLSVLHTYAGTASAHGVTLWSEHGQNTWSPFECRCASVNSERDAAVKLSEVVLGEVAAGFAYWLMRGGGG